MQTIKYVLLSFLFMANALAQEAITYQKPPQEILDLIDIERAPSVIADSKKQKILLVYRDQYKSIAELSEKELRLAGLRINPKTNIGSRSTYYNNIKLLTVASQDINDINGLPKKPRIANLNWSHDESKVAFTHTTTLGVELWYIDLTTFNRCHLECQYAICGTLV